MKGAPHIPGGRGWGGSTGTAPNGGAMMGTPATGTPGGAMGSTAAATTGFCSTQDAGGCSRVRCEQGECRSWAAGFTIVEQQISHPLQVLHFVGCLAGNLRGPHPRLRLCTLCRTPQRSAAQRAPGQ